MKRHVSCLVILSSIAAVFCFPAQSHADSFTLAQTWAYSYAGGCVPPKVGGACYAEDPYTAKIREFDIGNAGSSLSAGTAQADAAFGANQGRASASSDFLSPLGGSSLSITYSLEVLLGTSWIDVIQASISNKGGDISNNVDQILTGQFNFAFDVPYQVRSVLSIANISGAGGAFTQSTWDDAVTFTGGPGGSVAATFDVSLIASVTAMLYSTAEGIGGHPGPSYHSWSDVSASAVLTGIEVPTGVGLYSESGTFAIAEPSILLLLAIGLCGVGLAKYMDLKAAEEKE